MAERSRCLIPRPAAFPPGENAEEVADHADHADHGLRRGDASARSKLNWKLKKPTKYFENKSNTILKIKDLAAKIKSFSSQN